MIPKSESTRSNHGQWARNVMMVLLPATAGGMRPALDVDGVSKIASFFTAQQSRTRSVYQ